mmetsp:Transcript_5702/g.9042  ORF Transcript_5702/g.9042 Transcript_5702/m.9042 type:complete len:239 (+) Transcript_5702:1010-1726(+)
MNAYDSMAMIESEILDNPEIGGTSNQKSFMTIQPTLEQKQDEERRLMKSRNQPVLIQRIPTLDLEGKGPSDGTGHIQLEPISTKSKLAKLTFLKQSKSPKKKNFDQAGNSSSSSRTVEMVGEATSIKQEKTDLKEAIGKQIQQQHRDQVIQMTEWLSQEVWKHRTREEEKLASSTPQFSKDDCSSKIVKLEPTKKLVTFHQQRFFILSLQKIAFDPKSAMHKRLLESLKNHLANFLPE